MRAADFLTPGGPLARALGGFEHRAGQVEMAERIEAVLRDGGSLMVEAGTGIGKSFAYLVPALLCGERVVISTATRNLQDQLFEKDLPQLQEAIGSRVSAVRIKGRENYLCRRRWDEFRATPDLGMRGPRAADLRRIGKWAAKTRTGDRDELRGIAGPLDYWRGISTVSENCTGRRCALYDDCHLTTLRQQARQSRILIVNHHLLIADLVVRQNDYGEVLPDYEHLIVDEAHRLESAATQSLSTTVSSQAAERLATDLGRFCRRVEAKAPSTARLKRRFRALFEGLEPEGPRNGEARIFDPGELPAGVRQQAEGAGDELETLDLEFHGVLDRVQERAEAGGGDGGGPPTAHGAEQLRQRIAELRADLREVLAPKENTVFWSAWRKDGERGDGESGAEGESDSGKKRTLLVTASPIHAGESLGEALFGPRKTCVLTSATLAVEGGFDYAADALGIRPENESVLPSPFAYPEQTRLFVPDDEGLNPQQGPVWIERASDLILKLIRASRGRALLLFTSWRNLEAAAVRLDRASPYPLMRQERRGANAALLDRFRNTPGAVLLGVRSFWEGVDVPGAALTLLVVDKLPFPALRDPLHRARRERAGEIVGSEFGGYDLPVTALTLKQGLGRLIRTQNDVGLAAVLDSRLVRRRYGRTIVESLPDYPLITDPAEAERFLEAAP